MTYSISNNRATKKRLFSYLAATAFCALFSAVYEHFSHGVYVNFMIYAFAIPLGLGVIPQLVLLLKPQLDTGGPWQHLLHGCAVATLSFGAIVQGIVQIYGTTNPYTKWYLVIGLAMLAGSLLMWATGLAGSALRRSAPPRSLSIGTEQ